MSSNISALLVSSQQIGQQPHDVQLSVSLKPNRVSLALPETHVAIFSLKRVILFAEPLTKLVTFFIVPMQLDISLHDIQQGLEYDLNIACTVP